MPKKNDKKTNKSKQGSGEQSSTLFTMGELDLTLKIEFKKDDLERSESSSDKESNKEPYKLEELKELKDLSFLSDNEELWEKIQIKAGNENINSILLGNKNTKKRCKVEYICFGRPVFKDDEEFFDEIFDHATEKFGIIFNKTPLDEGHRYSLKIEMKCGKDMQTITLGSPSKEDEEEKEEKKKDKDKKKEKNEKKEKSEKKEEEEKKKKMKKMKRKKKKKMKKIKEKEMEKRRRKRKMIMRKMRL